MSGVRVLSTTNYSAMNRTSREVLIGFVSKTDKWKRSQLSKATKAEFAKLAEEKFESLDPETAEIALQETSHLSGKDQRAHYTACEVNKAGRDRQNSLSNWAMSSQDGFSRE